MNINIREIRENEYSLLNAFLYEAIFIPDGVEAPPKEIINAPELQVYVADFGKKDDICFVAESSGQVIGAVWVRIMDDYGHIEDGVPSFAISLYKEYRGLGIGTALMRRMLLELGRRGYPKASLAVQKANYAVKMYQKVGFEIVDENEEEFIMVCNMITYKEVDKTAFELYDQVSQNVDVHAEYRVKRIENGLGGFLLEEVPVEPYVKDLAKYDRATEYEKQFDITNWRFYMAFDGETPVGAATVAGETKGLNMLYGRDDACVLWDIRVADGYKHKGIGQNLINMAISGAKEDGLKQMIIECQNNNVNACKFYHRQGAVLSKVDMYAYYSEPEIRDEVQFVWYLDL